MLGLVAGIDARGRIELPGPARDFPLMAPARSRPHRSTERLELDRRRIRVLWNPKAGHKGGLPTNYSTFDSLVDLMGRHGLGEELIATASEEEAIAQAGDAVAHDYDVVVAAVATEPSASSAGSSSGRTAPWASCPWAAS